MEPPSDKRIELLQHIITRMAQNSFTLKGWAITVLCAILALNADKADRRFALLACCPAVLFWWLDGYYLMKERHFRKLSRMTGIPPGEQFRFDPEPDTLGAYLGAVFSQTVWPLYAALLGVCLIVALTA